LTKELIDTKVTNGYYITIGYFFPIELKQRFEHLASRSEVPPESNLKAIGMEFIRFVYRRTKRLDRSMKATQISQHIWSLKAWIFIPIHVWVVIEEDGVTLVDTGIPMMANGIMKFIKRLNAGPLQRVVLTHGHVDHVGAIKPILRTGVVPVFAHRKEIPYIEGEHSYRPGKKAVATLPQGGTQALHENELGQLQPVGSLTPYFTPGHSPGHVVYYHEQDQVLLAGDLFSSKKGKLRKPLFTPAMEEVLRSSDIVNKLRPARLEVCHGDSVFHPADQLDAYIAKEGSRLPAQSQ
jgi:glyoxylase-like metal-dependent hydrolase (beta-lactamase superfamily II)